MKLRPLTLAFLSATLWPVPLFAQRVVPIPFDSCTPKTAQAARRCLADLALVSGRAVYFTFTDQSTMQALLDDVTADSVVVRATDGQGTLTRSIPIASIKSVSWPGLDLSAHARRIRDSARRFVGQPDIAVQVAAFSGKPLTGTISKAGDLSFVLREASGWQNTVRYSTVSTLTKVSAPKSAASRTFEVSGLVAVTILLLPFVLIYSLFWDGC